RCHELLVAQERIKIPVQAGRFEIPVDHEHAIAGRGENPRDVGHRHRAAGAALVGIEGDDLAQQGAPCVPVGALEIPGRAANSSASSARNTVALVAMSIRSRSSVSCNAASSSAADLMSPW